MGIYRDFAKAGIPPSVLDKEDKDVFFDMLNAEKVEPIEYIDNLQGW